jgi:hypothetical protein
MLVEASLWKSSSRPSDETDVAKLPRDARSWWKTGSSESPSDRSVDIDESDMARLGRL